MDRRAVCSEVVTGDMIDKGPHSVAVLRLLMTLRATAPDSGGQAIVLSGNHEAEFLADPRADKAEDFIADLKKAGYAPEKVAACEGDIGEFLCSLLAYAARVERLVFAWGQYGGAFYRADPSGHPEGIGGGYSPGDEAVDWCYVDS